jgi:hypothetical protein
MTLAHIGPVLEPLMFAPAFAAVAWSLVMSRRSANERTKDDHDR